MRIRWLNSIFLLLEMRNEKPSSNNELDHFERNFGLDYVFSPYNIRFQFQMIDLSNLINFTPWFWVKFHYFLSS